MPCRILACLRRGLAPAAATLCLLPALRADVPAHWLDHQAPPLDTGVSFGVPFARGAMPKTQTFGLATANGQNLPVQSWPLAYWPDGSLKWVGLATVAGPSAAGPFTVTAGTPAAPAGAARVRVSSSDTTYEIDTGRIQVRIPKWGTTLIDSIRVAGREVARKGELVCVLQSGPDPQDGEVAPRERFGTKVEEVTIEQSGPVRAVVKITGKHRGLKSDREWLPFIVRLYFYAGQNSIRMVHTIIYDGDQDKDFIRGLGIVFSIPMREEIQNRHVRFSGENAGLWAEPIQPMKGRDGRFVADPQTGADVYPDQVRGLRVPNQEAVSARSRGWLADWAVWDDFKLVQPNADGFSIVKRTNPQSTWLPAGAGRRASGLVFAGDVSGGLAVSLKNFWQSYPSALEVRNASKGMAELYVWLWSQDAPAMDMRHYDTRAHGLEAVYEDVQPGLSSATGVARTSELTLFATDVVPSKDDTAKMARVGEAPAVIVCTPQALHAAQAFGVWGLEDRSTPAKRAIEDRLSATLNYYLTQPEQRRWYGFWDFGDVMHSYDNDRHVWRYDLGGMAWDDSELGSDMWLWYSFLHTGRPEVFRMAEAMTRQTGEVDTTHLGRWAGLGSRHNVRHWGDGAKEARISQAAYRRFYYYLTTDERTGDLMHEVVNADFQTIAFDPMREALPITPREKAIAPTRVRLGPDWLAFIGNWMTEWERTGDTKWRDKIMAGVNSLAAMPLGARTGRSLVMGYDPATGKLYALNDQLGTYNLATIMGGAEVAFEVSLMLDDPKWDKVWLQYCRLYSAPREMVLKDMQTGTEGADGSYARDGRLAGWVFNRTGMDGFKQAALAALEAHGRPGRGGGGLRHVDGPAALNPVDEGLGGTNGAAQNGLEAITMLGFVGAYLPTELPPAPPPAPGRSRPGDLQSEVRPAAATAAPE
jgi:hypothetical protein